MAIKIQTGEFGYTLEVDGNVSEPHRYDHAVVVKGPSGKLYGAFLEQGPQCKPAGKPQAYVLSPVDSIHVDKPLAADEIEDGYVEDPIYEEDEDEGEEEEEEGGEEDGEEESEDEDEVTIESK